MFYPSATFASRPSHDNQVSDSHDEASSLVDDDSDDNDNEISADDKIPAAPTIPDKFQQASLVAKGFTRTVTVASGHSIRISEDSQFAGASYKKKFRCNSCDFSSDHAPTLAHHTKKLHPLQEEDQPFNHNQSTLLEVVVDSSSDVVAKQSTLPVVFHDGVGWRLKPVLTVLANGYVSTKFELHRPKQTRGAPSRASYTCARKLRIIAKYKELKETGFKFPAAAVAGIYNVDVSLVSKWVREEDYLAARSKSSRRESTQTCRYPKLERALFLEFQKARKRGLRIGRKWLACKARALGMKLLPNRYFRASDGWLHNFLRRQKLSYRKKTNKKSRNTEERLPAIKRRHSRLRRRLQEITADEVLDQGTKNAGDKRFCTRQCCVRTTGLGDDGKHQQPRQIICFRGTGLRITQAERDAYDRRVIVRFQKKAYYDDAMCAVYVLRDFNPQVDSDSQKVLFSDNLSGQTKSAWVEGLAKTNTDCHLLLPVDVTNELQVIDQGVGNEIKKECGNVQDEYLVVPGNLEKWTEGFTASERRILITEWVAEACDRVFNRLDIVKLFLRTGMGMRVSP
eukprot:gene14391-17019_t